MISDNLAEVRQEIARHAALAGREPGEITLIAVSKTKHASMVVEAFEAGLSSARTKCRRCARRTSSFRLCRFRGI